MPILPDSPLEIPGVADTVVSERIERDSAFMPVLESLGPFEVLPLSLFHLLILRIIQSPLLGRARTPTPTELAVFLWVLSPEYSPQGIGRNKFLRRCRNWFMPPPPPFLFRRRYNLLCERKLVRAAELVDRCRDFVDAAFADAPPRRVASSFHPDYYSDGAALCGLLAREYGWAQREILEMPLKRIWQYVNEIRRSHDPDAVIPSRADPVIGGYLDKLNSELRKN